VTSSSNFISNGYIKDKLYGLGFAKADGNPVISSDSFLKPVKVAAEDPAKLKS
jgi:hypothetical protein